MASLFQAVVLGAVQGVTEFLPISSTAHLIIVQKIFGLDQELYGLTLDLFTSLGTTVALIIYFWKDIRELFVKFVKRDDPLPWWILGVTVLVSVAGLLAEPFVKGPARSLPVIAGGLIVFSIVMILAEKYSARIQNDAAISKKRTYLVGLAQIIAFIPGVSRSGATISSGLFLGMDRVAASRLSFILSAPIFLAAITKSSLSFAKHYHELGVTGSVLMVYAVSAAVAGVVGYLTIHYLLRFLQKHPLSIFAAYRLVLALVILIWIR